MYIPIGGKFTSHRTTLSANQSVDGSHDQEKTDKDRSHNDRRQGVLELCTQRQL